MAISAGQVFVDLGARLDRREFDAYERKLKETQERVQRKERFKAELGANYDERAFRSYQRDLDRAERANDNMIRSQGRLRTAFGSVYGRGGAMFAAAGGITAFVAAGKSVISTASDINESLTKNQVLFGRFSKDVEAFSKTSAASFGISRKAALEYTGVFGNLFSALGVSSQKSSEFSVSLTKLAADMASFNNTSIEDALEAIRSGLVGETEPLRRFGVNLNDATLRQEAMSLGLTHTTKNVLTPYQRSMAAQALIVKQTDKAHGDFHRTQGGLANQTRILRARVSDLGASIGEKLLPVATRAVTRINKFAEEMQSGTGEGGKFADTLRTDVLPALEQIGGALRIGGRLIGKFFDDFNSNERQVGGWVSGFGRAESSVLKFTGTLVGGRAGDQLKEWGRNVDRNADQVDRWREQLRIDKEVDGIERDIRRLRRTTSGSFRDIRVATKQNMDAIRESMTLESAAGRRAFGRNIRAAVTAIREAMKDGRVSAQTGLAEIRKLMLTQLRELGIRSAERVGAPLTQDPAKANRAQRYMGGWLGGRGLVGHDSIPAMLAPGEAVLNRHQQAVIEGMLGDGFLDRLFATVNRPHFMQRGGRIRMAVGGVTPAISSLIEELDSKGFRHGSTTGPGHAPGGYHPRGMAVDYGDASNDMQRLWSVVFPQRQRFAELFGPTRVRPGPHLMHNGVGFTNPTLQAGHQDHIHMALAAAIGALGSAAPALGAAWKAIRSPRTTMGGMLGDVVQGTLNRATSLANRRGRSLAKTAAGPDLSGGPGGGSNSANKALGRQMAAAMGWTGGEFAALDRLWTGESGWSNTARNPSSGAFGIPQALPPGKMGPAAAGGNARAQIAWGLNYIKERYGSPSGAYSAWLSRSPHWYARGGRAGSKLNKTVGGATAGLIRKIRPLQTDRSSQFESLMARVDSADQNYSRWERRFNISDEELVDADTGEVNVDAIKRKAKELTQLLFIRAGIETDLENARAVAQRIVHSYRRVVSALRKSLRHAGKKNRKGIRSYISQYEPRIGEWQGKVGEIDDSLFDTRTDILELRGELKDVLGTTPELRDTSADTADIGGDTGVDTGGGDTGGGTDTTTEVPPSPLQIAEATAAQIQTFLSGRQDLLQSFGRNYLTPGGAGSYFTGRDALDASAGARFFGGSSGGAGLGGSTVIANFASPPDNAPTFVQQMRFLVENGSG